MMKKWAKLTGIATVFVLTVAVFSFMMPSQIDAGLAKTKFLGNIIAGSVPSNFAMYWDQVTPENSTKWGSVEGTRNSMNWSQADMAYNYARSNGMPFKFHTLVWGSQEPGWVKNLSAAEQKAEVQQWIQAAGARYGGSQYVDVVNEPLHAVPSYANAIGGSGSTGWDWVVWSFEQARAAFPNSKLLINEYGIISDPNATSRYLNIINILKSRGLVDGIGIQCHYFNMDNVSTSTMTSVLNSLAATGLPIYVSELDMTGDDATQLSRYQTKFPVLWQHSAVAGITLWGYIEGQTWASGTHLITGSGAERPALQWLRQYLSTVSNPTPTTVATPLPTYGPRSAFSQIEAESFNSQSGIQTESCSEGGQNIGYIENGDYVVYNNIDFGNGATGFQARVASNTSGGNIEIRLGSVNGTLIGTCSVAGTGGWQTWTTGTCNVSGISGIHNLYLRFTGGSGYLFNLNWFKFTGGTSSSYVRFRNVATGLYIDGMGSTSNGSNACQWGNSSSYNQQWTIINAGSYVMIQNRATGLYLDGMGRTSNGSICGQWAYSGSSNQQWTQETMGSYVRFKNRATGLYLDGMGSTANGSNLCQWGNSGSANQQWQIQ